MISQNKTVLFFFSFLLFLPFLLRLLLFRAWTSENNLIDKFIQDAQIKARNCEEVIEWIPYDRLKDTQFLAKDGFSKVY